MFSNGYHIYRDSTTFAYDVTLARTNLVSNKNERYHLKVPSLPPSPLNPHPLTPSFKPALRIPYRTLPLHHLRQILISGNASRDAHPRPNRFLLRHRSFRLHKVLRAENKAGVGAAFAAAGGRGRGWGGGRCGKGVCVYSARGGRAEGCKAAAFVLTFFRPGPISTLRI